MYGATYVNRRTDVCTLYTLRQRFLRVPRATSRARGRFTYQKSFKVEGLRVAIGQQVGVVIGRSALHLARLGRQLRTVRAIRQVVISARGRIYHFCCNGDLIFDLFRGRRLISSQRPTRGYQVTIERGEYGLFPGQRGLVVRSRRQTRNVSIKQCVCNGRCVLHVVGGPTHLQCFVFRCCFQRRGVGLLCLSSFLFFRWDLPCPSTV